MEILNRWVEALESGKYPQGVGMLKTLDGRFCCLGILCELSQLDEWQVDGAETFYLGNSRSLPSDVRKLVGLDNLQGGFQITPEWHEGLSEEAQEDLKRRGYAHASGSFDSLAALNDSFLSFKTIAEIIKSRPKGLFAE